MLSVNYFFSGLRFRERFAKYINLAKIRIVVKGPFTYTQQEFSIFELVIYFSDNLFAVD